MRLLLAPIAITPTKPLTPSHIKGLLWMDVLYKATRHLHDIDYLNNRTTYDITVQTLGYWAYLDRTVGSMEFSECSEDCLGKLYVQYQAEDQRPSFETLRDYRERTEQGWLHPASRRILEIWQEHYRALGLYDPGLFTAKPLALSVDELIEYLVGRGLCIDTRPLGGPAYLDLSSHGIPLRRVIDGSGQSIYLVGALRELVPLIDKYDKIILASDDGLNEDYTILQRIITALGGSADRIMLGRVALDGVVRESRFGGWDDYTFDKIASFCSLNEQPEIARLALRLCLIGCLGKGSKQPFQYKMLGNCIKRAKKMLRLEQAEDQGALKETLQGLFDFYGYVEPHRLTSVLFLKDPSPAMRSLLSEVYLQQC